MNRKKYKPYNEEGGLNKMEHTLNLILAITGIVTGVATTILKTKQTIDLTTAKQQDQTVETQTTEESKTQGKEV